MLYKICKCSYTACISIKKENNLLKKKRKEKEIIGVWKY